MKFPDIPKSASPGTAREEIESPDERSVGVTRIVGLGASAGGLAPLEQFLASVPADSGMAYVVVQHLDPTRKALLSELLQRMTTMPVREACHNMRVEPDSVYVIPPNYELTILDNVLHLATPTKPRGLRLPINVLFSSLASTLGNRAIAVVLSGMGFDGTLGLQAVKAVGGLTVVQQPDSAQFDAMPRNAIASNCVDIVGLPGELASRIQAYAAETPDADRGSDTTGDTTLEPEPLQRIFQLLRQRSRHDFSLYKPSTLNRRIERRMAVHKVSSLAEYADFLQDNANETDLLFKELLIGVTGFFRDPAVWEQFAKVTLPALLDQRATEKTLRAWVVGCSTGEEAYSLAILFRELVRRDARYRDFTLQIFATDLSQDAITTARRGKYPHTIENSVSAEQLDQFFTDCDTGYQVKREIRDMVSFAQQDVLLDPPFTKIDLVFCRNLLIYFDPILQRRLIPLFHYSLNEGGRLVLGTAETVGRFDNLFTPIDSKLRIYQRESDVSDFRMDLLMNAFPPLSTLEQEDSVVNDNPFRRDNLQDAADQVLLQVYSPPAVLINGDGDILYISGRTGKYLEPAAGKANWNFHTMVREGLQGPINAALTKTPNQNEPIHLKGLKVQLPGGGEQRVDITIQALREPTALSGATMIVFRDVGNSTESPKNRKGNTASNVDQNAELQYTHEEVQNLREEARASREELQSANEELQSTNEELTTTKEETQSMNEELQTINAEMQTKLDDLALAQSDMRNLLNSIEIAILFLDNNLNVRRYTDRVEKLINIRESDVGRPASDLTSILQYPELNEDVVETLRTQEYSEKQVYAEDGRWFAARIMPYRTTDNAIDGVVITFVDITETKEIEQQLRRDLKV